MACEDTGDPFDDEYRLIRATAAVMWVHDSAVVLEHEGEAAVWQGVFDITERKEAEGPRASAEERYRSLVEQLPAVVYVDAVDDIATAAVHQPSVRTPHRLQPATAARRRPTCGSTCCTPTIAERVLAESDRTNESGEPFDMEYRIVRADGEIRWVRDQAFLIEGLDGAQAWQGVLTDITDRKVAEDALRSTGRDPGGGRLRRRATPARADVARMHRRRPRASRRRRHRDPRAALFENLEIDGEPSVQLRHAWLAPTAPAEQLDRPPSEARTPTARTSTGGGRSWATAA